MLDDALAAADALLGAEDDAATKTEGDPKFQRSDPLGDDEAGGAAALDSENSLDSSRIDWIHFGRLHEEVGSRFPHGEIDDLADEETLPADEVGRALEFRAATLRETLLLHEQIVGTQRVLTEYEAGQGGVGGMIDMASDLIGGEGDAGSEPPKAAELDLHLEDVTLAGGTINQEKIRWVDLHTAGRDLHVSRANFHAFCEKCIEHFVTREAESGGEGGLGGLLPEMPAVTGAIGTVQGIVFKAFDLFVALHFRLREVYEPRIDEAVHAYTLEAFKENRRPVYPAWFPAPPPSTSGGGGSGGGGAPPSNPLESAVADAKDKVDGVKDSIDEKVQDVKDFLGYEEAPPDAPGLATLDAIFQDLLGGDPDAPPSGTPNPNSSGVLVDTFAEVIADIVPDIVATVIERVHRANVGLLHRVYRAVLYGRASTPITADAMIRAGREELAETLVKTALELIPGLDFLADPDRKFLSAGSMDFGNEQLHNLAQRYLDQGLGAQIGKIAELSSASLAPLLEEAREVGGDSARSMEPFLGRLPYLLSLQFRNTFFPFVTELLNLVFGAAGGPLAGVTSQIQSFLSDAGDTYADVMETKEKVEHAKDALADGVDLTDAVKDPNKFKDDLLGTGGGGPGDDDSPDQPDPFPGSDRKTKGTGLPVTAAEAKEVKKQQSQMQIE